MYLYCLQIRIYVKSLIGTKILWRLLFDYQPIDLRKWDK